MKILIPFRNRDAHLKVFLPHIKKYLPEAEIIIGEQSALHNFNRGKIINVLFLETDPDYFVAHDVDMLPVSVDYSPRAGVTQLASSTIQVSNYLGGVTMYDNTTFRHIGGYHNNYYSRSEDCEQMFNLKRLSIPITERHGTFQSLPHKRNGPEFIPELWIKSQQKRLLQNQLFACKYCLIKTDIIEQNVVKLTVDL